mmetsp:Transcript_21870/g.31381  ORF Transcript_21870/g.31381 Transcript_21870/m.31381 type:complete len:120 (-) Transcript_21870:64-423(-)
MKRKGAFTTRMSVQPAVLVGRKQNKRHVRLSIGHKLQALSSIGAKGVDTRSYDGSGATPQIKILVFILSFFLLCCIFVPCHYHYHQYQHDVPLPVTPLILHNVNHFGGYTRTTVSIHGF